MHKVPPWQRPSSPPAPPQGTPDCSRRLGTPRGRVTLTLTLTQGTQGEKWQGALSLGVQTARRRQARPEEAQGASWGPAMGGTLINA